MGGPTLVVLYTYRTAQTSATFPSQRDRPNSIIALLVENVQGIAYPYWDILIDNGTIEVAVMVDLTRS